MLCAAKGDARERNETDGGHANLQELGGGIGEVADAEFVDALSITSAEMLGRLEPKLRRVALLKLEGFTNEEIGERIERSVATVERYLKMIRHRWEPLREET